jgi:hypothetical protein
MKMMKRKVVRSLWKATFAFLLETKYHFSKEHKRPSLHRYRGFFAIIKRNFHVDDDIHMEITHNDNEKVA